MVAARLEEQGRRCLVRRLLLLLSDRLALGCHARLLARLALRLDLRARRLAGLAREVMRVPRLRSKRRLRHPRRASRRPSQQPDCRAPPAQMPWGSASASPGRTWSRCRTFRDARARAHAACHRVRPLRAPLLRTGDRPSSAQPHSPHKPPARARAHGTCDAGPLRAQRTGSGPQSAPLARQVGVREN